MKLNEFITNVLLDIHNGLKEAKDRTSKRYYVDNSSNKGVNFDIAVTTVKSTGAQAEGTAKAGIIEVLGAGVGAKIENKNENSEVSRIQFTVHVPYETEQEEAESVRKLQEKNRNSAGFEI